MLMKLAGINKAFLSTKALNGVDMEIPSGKIIGLLGPNASGKTTLLKIMAGLLTEDSGVIQYPGGVARGVDARGAISFLPDTMKFPSWMKVADAFAYYRDMYPDYSEDRALEMIKLLELELDKKINHLSKGLQERVSLALVFSREAKLYLLDEPLGGIDPVGKAKVLESILSLDLQGSTVLLSTHLVRDVETIFDSVFFLSAGKVIFQADCEELRATQNKTVEQMYLEVFFNVKAV